MTTLTAEEKRAIRALKKLAENWPETLWLFAGDETLAVLRLGPEGKRMYKNGAVDQDFMVASIWLPSDGGDY